ncbi:hypothetical protein EDB86DRAFT_2835287 [Lactarius hatsudake]|nr:hypothetical protein EDB86DRAFT_2835287 [Lactarius hatsudake]
MGSGGQWSRRHVGQQQKAGSRGVDGEGADNELGSEGKRVNENTRGEGKVICSENTWDELDGATIGPVEVEEVVIRTQLTSSGGDDEGVGAAVGRQSGSGEQVDGAGDDRVARNGEESGVVLEGWWLEDVREFEGLFHWLIRALSLQDQERDRMKTSRWDGIRSKLWHRSRFSVSVSQCAAGVRVGVGHSEGSATCFVSGSHRLSNHSVPLGACSTRIHSWWGAKKEGYTLVIMFGGFMVLRFCGEGHWYARVEIGLLPLQRIPVSLPILSRGKIRTMVVVTVPATASSSSRLRALMTDSQHAIT